MDFELADIRSAHEAQVVAGMYYDRRVFLVVNTGTGHPIAIALTPRQAQAIGRDLVNGVAEGEIHRDVLVEPRAVPLAVQPRALAPPTRAWLGPAVRIIQEGPPDE